MRLPLLLTLLTLSTAHAQDGAVGFPVTGQIDDRRVLAARYGEAPDPPPARDSTSDAPAAQPGSAPHTAPAPAPQTATLPQAAPVRAAALPRTIKGGLTGIFIDSTAGGAQQDLPLTFGQVFAPGDVRQPERLAGRLADGSALPLQVDVKARHPDGSLRHALISAVVPALAARQSLMLALSPDGQAAPKQAGASPAALLGQGFRAGVSATIDGQQWSASAERLLAGKNVEAWLAGPVATEWLVTAPLVNAQGAAHPHLAARFAVRWYPKAKRARVDVTVENDWAWEPGPRNFRYDARVEVGGREVYKRPGLVHFHHARWRKVFWWDEGKGAAPAFEIRHDTPYLIASRAVANYDQGIVVADGALADLAARWKGDAIEPMGAGLTTAYMPMTGGRIDIGLLPAWAAMYVLSMDRRAREVTLGSADLAGSWPIHYRDKRTGRPVSLLDHPYMTLLGRPTDTVNPATGKQEAFPGCAVDKACDTPYTPDIPHQPNLAYLPYLLSGDHYYLEELQFWASYDAFSSNPGYRGNVKGLLSPEQVRGQAWALRTLGEAAYITPDADRLKPYFTSVVKHNLDWYNATYTDNPQANKLGIITNGYAFSYDNGTAIAPWQDDFFTSAVGHLADLGFPDARRLLAWKVRFPVARMIAPGTCWIDAAAYQVKVRDKQDSPVFATMAQVYAASHPQEQRELPCASDRMAFALKLRSGEMTGISSGSMGYPSNMQPALAYGADAGGQPGREAWQRFMKRSVKPDYSGAPQFAIVPRAPSDQEK